MDVDSTPDAAQGHNYCLNARVFDIQSMIVKEHSSSAASHAIIALAMRLFRREVASAKRAQLTLCYLLPDERGQAPFEGMRLGTHDAEKAVLTIEACVPQHIVDDPSRAGRYVLAVAADAIDAAREFFVDVGVEGFDAETLQAWVTTIKLEDLLPPNFQQVRNTDFEWS